jgi:peptidoglycan glycosyltransferase
MNSQITKLFAMIVALFGILVGFTSAWSVFSAEELEGKRANKRPLLEQQQIQRGRILASDGTVIARSVPRGKGEDRTYHRTYPTGSLFGHPIGYSYVERSNSEFEQFHDDELSGEEDEFTSILDELEGQTREGNDVVSTLDPAAKQIALDQLSAQGSGAVVAIEPDSGRVRVMASWPPFDPNEVARRYGQLANDNGKPLFNRATQGQYPPGSTFKVVTAAAGLDSGTITADSTIDSPAVLDVQGQPLANADGTSYGPIPLSTGLTNSVNTYFAQLGLDVGQEVLFEYMDRFGFGSRPQIDLPSDQVYTSGVFDFETEEFLGDDDPVDLARVAFGQERLLVTPLQMAQVSAAVANGGTLMRPRLWDRVIDPDGRLRDRMAPKEQSEVMSEDTAGQLTEAMTAVVQEGTGTAAALQGIDVAGKTGTADVESREECGALTDANQAWFIGFAPAADPKIAVAATIECTTGFGGEVAAPIAAAVMQEILAGG